MNQNDELVFFDCNITYGPKHIPPLKQANTPEELLAEMDHCGIDEALITSTAQRSSPWDGNLRLVEEVKGFPRLHPAWVLLPHQTGEMPPPHQLVEEMIKNRVAALWALPGEHHYILDGVSFGSLFEEMIAHHIPLFYSLSDLGDTPAGWREVSRLLKDFPELTLIAVNQSVWGEDHFFRPLVEKFPNFHMDTSHYELANGLRDFYLKYGAERWLFGTAFPKRCMGGSLMQLINTDIPIDAKQAIASGNLKRLLAQVKP